MGNDRRSSQTTVIDPRCRLPQANFPRFVHFFSFAPSIDLHPVRVAKVHDRKPRLESPPVIPEPLDNEKEMSPSAPVWRKNLREIRDHSRNACEFPKLDTCVETCLENFEFLAIQEFCRSSFARNSRKPQISDLRRRDNRSFATSCALAKVMVRVEDAFATLVRVHQRRNDMIFGPVF